MEEAQRYELEEFVSEIEKHRARHTELITVYVPAGYDLNNIIKQLESEKSTAGNIKSKTTQKNVIDALESLVRQLRLIKRNPLNGLALFSGNVAEREGQSDVQVWSFEPPMPLRVRLYRCDQEFVLEPLKEMLEATEIYGLVVIDRNEATLGLLEGKQIKFLQHMTSGVPGKTEKGGQCLSPDSLVETKKGNTKIESIKVGDEIKALDIPKNKIIFTKCINKWKNTKDESIEILTINKSIISSLDHIFFLLTGDRLVEMPADLIKRKAVLLNYDLKSEEIIKINRKKQNVDLIDIETESGNFFANGLLVHNSAARYARIREGMAKEFFRRVADAFKSNFWDMKKLKGIIVGGPGPTKEDFLKEGQIVTALKEKIIGVKDIGYADPQGLEMLVEASKDILAEQEITREKKILEDFFNRLGKQPEKTAYGLERVSKALSVGAVDTLILDKKIDKKQIHELEEKARNISAKIELVSEETEEGQQFKSLGGVGAVLRFAI